MSRMNDMECARCGDDEDRIDGYCSFYCRDMAELEARIAELEREIAELKSRLHPVGCIDVMEYYKDDLDPSCG